jgi:sialate O-acetylesterase
VEGFAEGGPLLMKQKIRKNEITLTFKNTDGGLGVKGKTLKGFAIAGADKKWVRADARLDGNKVIVSSPEVPSPVAVRYAWADNPEFSLFNGMGLPASPFRTDDWK